MLRLSVLTLVAAALALTAAASQSPPPDPGAVEAELLQAANGFRAQNGFARLTPNAELSAEARAFAEYLAATGRFSHTADGREPADRARAAGYDYCELAENLAHEQDSAGVSIGRLTHLFMAGWEGSPGHRRNLLNPDVTETGVGVATAPGAAHTYLAVQVFGRPISARYSFRIDNRSEMAAGYVFDGEHRVLAPHTTVVHTTCAAGDLVFDREVAGGDRRYHVGPGAALVLSPAFNGVQIEVQHRPHSRGRLDED